MIQTLEKSSRVSWLLWQVHLFCVCPVRPVRSDPSAVGRFTQRACICYEPALIFPVIKSSYNVVNPAIGIREGYKCCQMRNPAACAIAFPLQRPTSHCPSSPQPAGIARQRTCMSQCSTASSAMFISSTILVSTDYFYMFPGGL